MRHIKTYEQLNNEQKFDIISPENTLEILIKHGLVDDYQNLVV